MDAIFTSALRMPRDGVLAHPVLAWVEVRLVTLEVRRDSKLWYYCDEVMCEPLSGPRME
jgi:hypothetical protein